MRGAFGLISLIVVLGIGLFIYRSNVTGSGDVTMGTGNIRAAADLTGVKNDLNAMAQAERAFMALNGRYASLEELHSSGNLVIDPVRGRQGYSYQAEIGSKNFTIKAIYGGPADMPEMQINETMQVTEN